MVNYYSLTMHMLFLINYKQGCDASVLLDDDPKTNLKGEKSAIPNADSLLGFDIIDKIKDKLEKKMPWNCLLC